MNTEILPHSRGRQILTLLHRHGPLTVGGIQNILQPRIQRKRVREVMDRLYTRGFVLRNKTENPTDAHYYWLTRSKKEWPEIAKRISVPIENFDTPKIGRQAVAITEEIAVWAEKIKQQVPQACVLKKNEIMANPAALKLLTENRISKELLPDILMLNPVEEDRGSSVVAVEIAHWQKPLEKQLRKIKAYSRCPAIHGVLYLASCDDLDHHRQETVKARVLDRGIETKAAHDHFFAWSARELRFHKRGIILVTHGDLGTRLTHWIYGLGLANSAQD